MPWWRSCTESFSLKNTFFAIPSVCPQPFIALYGSIFGCTWAAVGCAGDSSTTTRNLLEKRTLPQWIWGRCHSVDRCAEASPKTTRWRRAWCEAVRTRSSGSSWEEIQPRRIGAPSPCGLRQQRHNNAVNNCNRDNESIWMCWWPVEQTNNLMCTLSPIFKKKKLSFENWNRLIWRLKNRQPELTTKIHDWCTRIVHRNTLPPAEG